MKSLENDFFNAYLAITTWEIAGLLSWSSYNELMPGYFNMNLQVYWTCGKLVIKLYGTSIQLWVKLIEHCLRSCG